MPIKERITNLSKRDQALLNRALAMANLSDCKQKHAAIIVKGGRIIGSGVNTFRNSTVSDFPGGTYTNHAESNALRSIKAYRSVGKIGADSSDTIYGARIYIARVSRRRTPAFSRPCDACFAELISAGITDIIYTTGS